MVDPTWIKQGTGVNPDNYHSRGIAPYAAGPKKVEIPFVALHMLLAEPFAS